MTGSFHTIVTHGLSSDGDLVGRQARSTSTGWRGHAPIVHGTSLRRESVSTSTAGVDRAAHRPLRADHAAGGAAVGHRAPPLRLRAVPATAARRAPVRRRRRHRPGARRDRALPLRRRRARPARASRRRRRARPSTGWPTTASPATSGATPRARRTSRTPRCWSSSRTFAEAVLLETLLLSIFNHDSAIASAASRMTWAAGDRPCIEMGSRRTHEEAGGRLRPGGVRRRLRRHLQPRAPASGTASRRPAPARTPSRCCTTREERRVPRAGRRRSARAPRCSSTPTTSPRRCASASRSPARSSARCGIDSGDLGVLAHQVRAQLDALGATEHPRSSSPATSTSTRSPALAAAPVDGYGVGTQLVTGSGHPTCGFVYKLVAREGADGELVGRGQEEQGQVSVGGRKYALRRRSADGDAEAEVDRHRRAADDDGDDRPLLVPLVTRRRGRRPRAARGRARAAPAARARAAPRRAAALQGRARRSRPASRARAGPVGSAAIGSVRP